MKKRRGTLRRLGFEVLEGKFLLSGLVELPLAGASAPVVGTPVANPDIVLAKLFDVNNDGAVTPTDPLLVINFIDRVGDGVGEGEASGLSADVSGDGNVSALDVLSIINDINLNGSRKLPIIVPGDTMLGFHVYDGKIGLGVWESDIPINLVTAKVSIRSGGIGWQGQGPNESNTRGYGSLTFELVLKDMDSQFPGTLKTVGAHWVSPTSFVVGIDGNVNAVNFGHRDDLHRLPANVTYQQIVFSAGNFLTPPGSWMQVTLETDYGSVVGPIIRW
ncbi:MAG: dockerin type I domain-containing protein [bacterium]|nr:dockerin type I domain-containing protein [bacterium]